MKLSMECFLGLRFRHEFHAYHKAGRKCIYQDLIKKGKTIREILFAIMSDSAYLDVKQYESSPELKYDHMKHYIYCIRFGFRRNVIRWRDDSLNHNLSDPEYYVSLKEMDEDEINTFLAQDEILVDWKGVIHDGLHRCFSMIGRIMRGERYIPLRAKQRPELLFRNAASRLFRPRIKNVGYRTKDNPGRLKQIYRKIRSSNFTLLDVGSNYGYFSASLAAGYPNSNIYSMEGSFGTGNEDHYSEKKGQGIIESKGIRKHIELKNEHLLFNNHILCMVMTKNTIDSLIREDLRFDYQLSLSVFHWIAYERYGNDGSPGELIRLLADYLCLADTTFIELPDIHQETSLSPLYENYSGIQDMFMNIKREFFPDIHIEALGSYKWYGVRHLFHIRLNKPVAHRFEKERLIAACNPVSVY